MERILTETRRPDITFHRGGQIDITARVARILRLSRHSCINIAVHEGEYMLFAVHYPAMVGRHAARCYPVNGKGQYFRANSVRLCRVMLEACGGFGLKPSHGTNFSTGDAQGGTGCDHPETNPAGEGVLRVALMCGEPVSVNGKVHLPIITRTIL